MPQSTEQLQRRRTFAIISHPDAGKTTLTEKLLLFGGAIQLAGAVKARGEQRRARSDWLQVERQRGISVTASAMRFDHDDHTYNLLDTPGHEDFSEDTYRTLTAVDSVVMVLDAAKGIEAQTLKLFEVCRLRGIPMITFINKLDREGQEPFALLDEIERTLALEPTPASWPIGMGKNFLGCYDLLHDRLLLVARKQGREGHTEVCRGLEDPALDRLLPESAVVQLRDEVRTARALCPGFNHDAFRAGDLTPVFFGSALNNFGVRELLAGLSELAPPPQPQTAVERRILPEEEQVTGFVFKIQANMDPKHRDRVAFVRLCSGHLRRGMKLVHVRSGTVLPLHNPVLFLAQERGLAEEAWAGDIIGIPNHGKLRIGDTLTEGEALRFTGIPSFAPELLRRVRTTDPMRAKHLSRALHQMAEEGAARIFKPRIGADFIVGVVGALQFEVLAERIKNEYGIPLCFESAGLLTARWVSGEPNRLREFEAAHSAEVAEDHSGDLVFLARNAWHLETTIRESEGVTFSKVKEN
jgi:peptide chain release factor 3